MLLSLKVIPILLFSFLILGCAATSGFKNTASSGYDDFLEKLDYKGGGDGGTGAGLKQNNYNLPGVKKGVVVNFRENKPPNPINGDFEVEVLVGNYMGSYDYTYSGPTNVQLSVFDTVELQGFDDQTASLSLDPPIFNGKNFVGPSVYVFNPNRNFNYYGNINAATTTQFIARLEYDVRAETEVNFCVSNPDGEFDMKCDGQALQIAEVNDRYPVRINSIQKKVIGKSDGNVEVILDVNIADQGNGEITFDSLYGEGVGGKHVGFNIFSDVGNLVTCTSKENIDKSNQYDSEAINLPMTLDLAKKSASVQCRLLVSVNSPAQQVKLKVNIDYGYGYTDTTGSIKVNG